MSTAYRAEHVGSLLRPRALLEARAARAEGRMSLEELRELEDRSILEALALQREAGIQVFTDGELRRENWMAALLEEVGGTVPVELPTGEGWHRDGGPDADPEEVRFQMVAATEKVSRKSALTGVEAAFMAEHSPGQYKLTIQSSSMGAMMWNPELSTSAYPTPEPLIQDLAALQAQEIESLIDKGVNWIQLDSLSYMQVIDRGFAARLGQSGVMLSEGLNRSVAVDNQLVRTARNRNPDVTVGLHFCRGNNRSAYAASGGYDPVAEKLFAEVDVDRLLLEYDTERAGGFEARRFVPKGRTVVLGLVSSKVPALESPDDLKRRIDEAAKYVPLEQLALSPQCGFASTSRGNLLTVDEEKRKLELVVETARQVWG